MRVCVESWLPWLKLAWLCLQRLFYGALHYFSSHSCACSSSSSFLSCVVCCASIRVSVVHRLQDSFDECLKNPLDEIQDAAVTSFQQFSRHYYAVSTPELQARVIDKYGHCPLAFSDQHLKCNQSCHLSSTQIASHDIFSFFSFVVDCILLDRFIALLGADPNPSVTRGCARALGVLPRSMLVPQLTAVVHALIRATRIQVLGGCIKFVFFVYCLVDAVAIAGFLSLDFATGVILVGFVSFLQTVVSQRDAETRKYAITSLLAIYETVTQSAEVDYVLSVQDPTTTAASAASGAEAKADDDVEIDIDEFGNVVERPKAKVVVKKSSTRPDWMEITVAGMHMSRFVQALFFQTIVFLVWIYNSCLFVVSYFGWILGVVWLFRC